MNGNRPRFIFENDTFAQTHSDKFSRTGGIETPWFMASRFGGFVSDDSFYEDDGFSGVLE